MAVTYVLHDWPALASRCLLKLYRLDVLSESWRCPANLLSKSQTVVSDVPSAGGGGLPPGTKPIHARKNSWGINVCASVFALARIQEHIFEE